MTPAELAALKTYLQTDPDGRGFAAPIATGDMIAVAELGNADHPSETVARTGIPSREVVNEIAWTDLQGTQDEKDALYAIISAGEIDADNSRVKAAFATALSDVGGSITRLVAVARRPKSYFESAIGVATVTHLDCARALAS